MKIVFLASGLRPPGGIQRFSAGVLSALRENGHIVRVVSRDSCSSKTSFAIRSVLTVLSVRPSLVLAGHVRIAPLCRILSLLGFRYAVFLYGIETWNGLRKGEIRALARAVRIVSISEFTKEKAIAQTHLPERQFLILPPFVDDKEFYIKERDHEFLGKIGADHRKVALTVSRLDAEERYKGYDKVLDAIPRIVKEIPDFLYILAGEGTDSRRIREEIKQRGLEEYVMMPGFVPQDELVDYYNACDVFVMPSLGEGFGIVFLEALACGKPAIGGNKDASREALRDGELGVLVDPEDEASIGNALLAALSRTEAENDEERRLLRKKALEYYGYARFRKELDAVVGRIVSGVPIT